MSLSACMDYANRKKGGSPLISALASGAWQPRSWIHRRCKFSSWSSLYIDMLHRALPFGIGARILAVLREEW